MTYVNLGNLHQHLGRVEHAIGCYRKAIDLNPALPDAHLNPFMGVLVAQHLGHAFA